MASFSNLLFLFLAVTIFCGVAPSPVSHESGSGASGAETAVKCTKNSTTATAAEAEHEPLPEPKPSSSGEESSKPKVAADPESLLKEAEHSKDATKPTNATTTKITTTTEKPTPTTKAPAATTKTTTTATTAKPAPATLNITEKAKPEVKSESVSVSKPVESAPLKIESREGKSMNLNKTEYAHGNLVPEPEPESMNAGNSTHNKNETMKANLKSGEKAPASEVHETIEKKNATLAMEGKKSDEKSSSHSVTKKPETSHGGSDNSSTVSPPVAAAKTNGSPASITCTNTFASFLSLSLFIIPAQGIFA